MLEKDKNGFALQTPPCLIFFFFLPDSSQLIDLFLLFHHLMTGLTSPLSIDETTVQVPIQNKPATTISATSPSRWRTPGKKKKKKKKISNIT
jgi:hypothetical protein